ncbi:MAG: hypothetical protein AAFZ92_09650 [Pseudomonadota bacterium]
MPILKNLNKCLQHAFAPDILLMISAVVAITVAKLLLVSDYYNLQLDIPVVIAIGVLEIKNPYD